jgi:putative ABC transport system permease protein
MGWWVCNDRPHDSRPDGRQPDAAQWLLLPHIKSTAFGAVRRHDEFVPSGDANAGRSMGEFPMNWRIFSLPALLCAASIWSDPAAAQVNWTGVYLGGHLGAGWSHTDWRDVRTSAIFETQLNFVFLAAFSAFAILGTILVVASSITSIVLSQFKQIGMLKAIGFTQSQILWLYLGQYLVLSLIGSSVGLGLGILLAPLAVDNIAASLNTTSQTPFDLLLVALVFSIIPGIVILATLGAAHRGARANIIRAIAVGAEAPRQKPFWGVKLATRLSLPVTFILGLDDVFAKPWRSCLTGLNLTLGVMGIVFGLTLNETKTKIRLI